MKHVCIIGGGISGLASAWYLQKFAPNSCYTLLEATQQVGGKIKTDIIHNFVIEAGPESILIQKPAALNLCEELGLADHVIPMESSNVYIRHNGQFQPIPDGFKLIVPTNQEALLTSNLFSGKGKQRILAEETIPPRMGDGDESLADFVRRRFGEESLQRLAGPLMGGIYVADPEKLSMKSAFPQLVKMEKKFGSLITAMRNREAISTRLPAKTAAQNSFKPKNQGKKSAIFFSLQNGLAELTESLYRQLTGKVQTQCKVQRIVKAGKKFEVLFRKNDHIECDAVICTVAANQAAKVMANLNPRLAAEMSRIRFVSSAAVSLGFHKQEFEQETDFNGTGFIMAADESRKILSCGFTSRKSRHRSPADRVLLRCFLGGEGREDILNQADQHLIEIVQEELKDLLGIRCHPVLKRVYRWHKANPQFDVGHMDCVQNIEALTSTIPGLFLTGCSYHGVGIPDCIANAKKTVEKLLTSLTNHC